MNSFLRGSITVLLSFMAGALCATYFPSLNGPESSRIESDLFFLGFHEKASYYGLTGNLREENISSMFPDGEYSIFVSKELVELPEQGGAPDLSRAWFRVENKPQPMCRVSVSNGFSLKSVFESPADKTLPSVNREKFNGYVSIGDKTFWFNRNLIFDGVYYYISDKDMVYEVYELSKRCR